MWLTCVFAGGEIRALPAAKLTELGKKLKQRCGTGGTVKDFTIEIQGDHRETVERELTGMGFRVRGGGGLPMELLEKSGGLNLSF